MNDLMSPLLRKRSLCTFNKMCGHRADVLLDFEDGQLAAAFRTACCPGSQESTSRLSVCSLVQSFDSRTDVVGLPVSLPQDTVSVHRPGFYADRFFKFMSSMVFKKSSCEFNLTLNSQRGL